MFLLQFYRKRGLAGKVEEFDATCSDRESGRLPKNKAANTAATKADKTPLAAAAASLVRRRSVRQVPDRRNTGSRVGRVGLISNKIGCDFDCDILAYFTASRKTPSERDTIPGHRR